MVDYQPITPLYLNFSFSFGTPFQCGVHAIDQLLQKKEAHLNDEYALLKEYFIEFEGTCAVRAEIKSLLDSGMSWK